MKLLPLPLHHNKKGRAWIMIIDYLFQTTIHVIRLLSIYNKIFKSGFDIENSKSISPRIQQSLLHWSYIVNNEDYETWKLEKQK